MGRRKRGKRGVEKRVEEWKRNKREWRSKREEAEKGREQRWEKEGGAGGQLVKSLACHK